MLDRQSAAGGFLESPDLEAAGVPMATDLDEDGRTRSSDARPAAAPQPAGILIGTTLHHYRLVGRLGAGGMGEVYAAEDTKLGRRVALKVLPPEMAADPELLQRFRREARAVAALNHPNIVTIYSVEETDRVQFLTMELVEGTTLAEIIPPGGLPLDTLLEVALPLVEAVAFAHDQGIVHRDLKPTNIMLAGDGRVKVLDFGLAKLKPALSSIDRTQLSESLTQHHAVVGTAAYMSPEQAEGRPVDHRSDIFSLGVVLYEMACGKRPFRGDSFVSMISALLKDTPAPVSAVNRTAPPALDRILTRALAKDPAERYQSALDLRNDLQQIQQQTAAVRFLSSGVRELVRWRPLLWLAAGVCLVATVAAAVSLIPWRPPAAPRPVPLAFRTSKLTGVSGVEQFPSLLPDGRFLVYASQHSGNMDIWFVSTTSQDASPHNLTEHPADDDQPAVSRDGGRIAFRSSRERGGIFVMGIGGEGVRRVAAGVSAAFNPTWSPDGKEIAYTTENIQLTPLNWERKSELWIVNVETDDRRRITIDNDAVQASWSPNGHRIAYVTRPMIAGGKDDGGRSMRIETISAQGGRSIPLTDGSHDWCPVWAPDGRHVYFVTDRAGGMNLWRVPVDEASGEPLGSPEAVTTGGSFLAHPAISADGKRIAYVVKEERTNIQRLQVATDPVTVRVKGEEWVTSGSRLWANPDPSPTGEWVVFYSRAQPEGDLYVSRPDRTGLRLLTGGHLDRVPRWSPDGNWIAFFSTRSGTIAVWKIRSDGSGLQQISEAGGVPVWEPAPGNRLLTSEAAKMDRKTFILDPNLPSRAQAGNVLPLPPEELRPFIAVDWSPDRTKLAGQVEFSDRGVGGRGIAVYSFASRTYERLTDFGEWPAWLPDSRRLLFVSKGREFHVMDTRTRKAPKMIYSTVWDTLGPPRLTRDGRVAYFSRRQTEADIYLITFE